MNSIIQILFTTIKHLIKRIIKLEEQIQQLNNTVNELLKFIVQSIPFRNWRHEDLHSPKYQKFKTDELPIIKTFEPLDHLFFLDYIELRYGKPIKPVKHRNTSTIPQDLVCPKCGATHQYLYDNNGGKGQFKCKLCDTVFALDNKVKKPVVFLCPYCGKSLEKIKTRKEYFIHKCQSLKCPYYLKNKRKAPKNLSHSELSKYKLHYIYREFYIDFFNMDLHHLPKGIINFKHADHSAHTIGLCLTYNINLQLSLRKTALALKEIHGINISHQTVANYARTAAMIIKPYVDTYDYEPTTHLAADETYIKVRGFKHYIWLVMDAVSRSILGYHVSDTRSVGPCILAMRMTFEKFKEFPQNIITFVADGYSAYPLAAQQFEQIKQLKFSITQVIGLTNDDPVSTEFRPYKQKIERANRTLKENYRYMCGYDNIQGAQYAITLWVAYYNFLRLHSIYGRKRTLNIIPDFQGIDNMPQKWVMLISLGQKTIVDMTS